VKDLVPQLKSVNQEVEADNQEFPPHMGGGAYLDDEEEMFR
jgi:hypothetical protein